jgi:predicted O-linked N-acetylglucosamine transferase (SPINDLY family)
MTLKLDIDNVLNLFNSKKLDEAETKCIELLNFNSDNLFLLNIYGVILFKKNFYEKAINQFKKIIKIDPKYSEAHYNIGTIFFNLLKFKEAADYFNSAILINKDYFEAYFNLAECYRNLDILDDAILNFKKCLKYKPNDFEIYNNLGLVYQKANQIDYAFSSYKKALEIKPDFFQVYNNLGVLCLERGQLEESIIYFNKCIQINREFVPAYNNLGMAFNKKRKYASAILILEEGLKIDSNFKNIYANLADSFKKSGKTFKAIEFLEKELLNNKCFEVLEALGNCWCSTGEILKGLDFYKESLKLNPNNLPTYQNYIFNLNYLENFRIEDYFFITDKIRSLLKKYDEKDFEEINVLNSKNDKIKIGFVSADFRKHAVGYQVFDVIKNLANNNEFELFAYYNDNQEDSLSKKLKLFFKSWTEISFMNDLSVLKKIKSDNINILIDLSGYTAGNRMGIFFNKPAAVQISWAGYLASTGLSEIDYIIADKNSVTKDEEIQFKEKIWRMSDTWSVLSKEDSIILNSKSPAIKNGYITFGSFNNIKKINKNVIKVWSKILCNSNSKLFLKTKELDDPFLKKIFKGYFLENGVKEDQLIFEESSDRVELLNRYNLIDLALDPFPYNGGTTSLECTWMCVPVLTKKGKSFLSKCGESINTSLNLGELIAKDDEEYISKAVNYSKNLNRVQEIKEYLVKNRNNIKIFNSKNFADELSNSFKSMLSLNKF